MNVFILHSRSWVVEARTLELVYAARSPEEDSRNPARRFPAYIHPADTELSSQQLN